MPTTIPEIFSVIKSLKNKKSVEDDNFPVNILKEAADIISEPLSFLINLYFEQGIYPDLLKYAIVESIHMKGAADDEKNYRLISLLSSVGKIFERIINQRFLGFLESHSIIALNQNGFVKVKSIYQALSNVLDSLNSGKITVAMCIDLSKAFDSVNHKTLCIKLEHLCIRGNALRLITSYLKNRTQKVMEIDNYGRFFLSDKLAVMRVYLRDPF